MTPSIAVFGSSLVSAYWNGAATYYRGIFRALAGRGYGAVTTEVADAGPFYFAEDYHQQYLAKNPMGYCGLGGTGVACQVGTSVAA